METTERTMAPRMAASQPSTMKPGTKRVVSLRTIALTTNINRPKVMTVRGRVNNRRIGLMKVLMTARTMAASKAEVKASTLNPGTI